MTARPDITVITPNRNGARFLEKCVQSVIRQREDDVRLEYLVFDGGSTDGSLELLNHHTGNIDDLVSEPDGGPTAAINKGLRRAKGDIVAWLNADDSYYPGALRRVVAGFAAHPQAALGFGRCTIVDENDREIRRGITRFKEAFFPFSSHFAIQSINYVSQPAMFFRRSALAQTGLLRDDLKAAWDYDFILRLWRQGGGFVIKGPPLATFRWHEASISGQHFRQQFKEEFEVAVADAGRLSPQAWLHGGVRWGIVGAYSLMAARRRARRARGQRKSGKI